MKTKLMLRIENKRLKKRVSELEQQIENINNFNNQNLKLLRNELSATLEALNNEA